MTKSKTCFKCDRFLPLEEFYKHPRMGDGHLNKCKDCAKKDVSENYAKRREQYSEYERERYQRPERKAAVARTLAKHRARNPDKARARQMVGYYKRRGVLKATPCVHCGTRENVQAHHSDYSKPLEVTWVCFKCHREHEHGQIVSSKAG